MKNGGRSLVARGTQGRRSFGENNDFGANLRNGQHSPSRNVQMDITNGDLELLRRGDVCAYE